MLKVSPCVGICSPLLAEADTLGLMQLGIMAKLEQRSKGTSMEALISFEPGEIIFKQGELSNSMLMIKEGSVEVYKDTPHGEVLLTVQNPGEVVGVLSFFNHGRRLANARARSNVEAQLIERKDGIDPLAKLPKWVQVVLKEFSIRLDQINDQFAKTLQEKNDLLERVMDPVAMSIQLADCLAELGPFKAKKFPDGQECLILDEIMDLIESCLGYERTSLNRILDIFKNTGLIKVEIEQDHGKEVLALSGALRLKWYCEFVRSTRSGKNRRLMLANIPFKQRKMLFALRDFVHKTGGDVNKGFDILVSELVDKFESVTKIPLDQATIDNGHKLGLVELSGSGEKATLNLHPTNLARTLIAINTLKRLKAQPGADFEEDDERKAS
jgi:CRP-like cAMP-binding protein